MLRKTCFKFSPFIVVILSIFQSSTISAQDPNFSQYYAAPQMINPALTGVFSGDVRVNGLYRSQWPAIQNPFVTGAVSVDANAFKNYLNDRDFAGIGFNSMFDNSNNGGLKTSQLGGSFSFHKSLDNEGIHHIGLGFQASYTTKSLDYSKLIFSQQLTSTGFDPTLPTGEAGNGYSGSYFDYSAGMLYSGLAWENNIYFGAAYFHINQPKLIINGSENAILPRYTIQAGGDFLTGNENKFYLSGLLMKSGNSQSISIGAVYGYTLFTEFEESSLLFGAWYRHNDAIAPYIGLHMGNIQTGLTYDVNYSKLKNASLTKGGFELSLKYTFSNYNDTYKIPNSFLRY